MNISCFFRMTSLSELESSVSEYQAQLDMITTALAADQGNTELLELESQLTTLIQLTKDSVLEMKKADLLAQVDELSTTDEDTTKVSSNIQYFN